VVGNLWQRTPWGERYVGYFWQGKFWELYPGVME
jgi:hypothetical protein